MDTRNLQFAKKLNVNELQVMEFISQNKNALQINDLQGVNGSG